MRTAASGNDRVSAVAVALLAALDARDRYTAGHSAAVAVYARDITRGLGLSEADRQLAHVRPCPLSSL
jgi:HD-GYP domain-containing protein (c-di-GMP phosphodiesterase class II)